MISVNLRAAISLAHSFDVEPLRGNGGINDNAIAKHDDEEADAGTDDGATDDDIHVLTIVTITLAPPMMMALRKTLMIHEW